MKVMKLREGDDVARMMAWTNQTTAVYQGDVYLASSMTGLWRIRRLGEPETTIEHLSTEPITFVIGVNDRLFCGFGFYPDRHVLYEVLP